MSQTFFCSFVSSSLLHRSAIMSSLEEPLGFDKLPSMSTVDRIQRFSSGACRPREDNIGMGNCWIEGRICSTSNSCRYSFVQRKSLGSPGFTLLDYCCYTLHITLCLLLSDIKRRTLFLFFLHVEKGHS